MNIYDYFDVRNEVHLKAFKHLNDHGCWTVEFYKEITEKDIDISCNRQISIAMKLAMTYIEDTLK